MTQSQPDIFEEIKRVRNFDTLPAFYRAMRPYPRLTAQFWESLKAAMAPGHLDAKTKELIAIAICVALGARYCTDSHLAIARTLGASEGEIEEVLMLVSAYSQTAIVCAALDPKFDPAEYGAPTV